MNRRGFFGLLGKLVAIGTTLRIDPRILAPARNIFGIGDDGDITPYAKTQLVPTREYDPLVIDVVVESDGERWFIKGVDCRFSEPCEAGNVYYHVTALGGNGKP